MIPAFPFFPKGNKKNKKYDTGRRAIEYPWPVCFYSIFFSDMNTAHESKSNKTLLHIIGELIGVPNTVIDTALHDLKDKIDKDPQYKDIKKWLESLPKI